jgi:hypothetical protein
MLAEIIKAAAASLFIVASGYGTGHILTNRWNLSDWDFEDVGLRTLLGLGVNSLALFLIGCWLWSVLVVYVVLTPTVVWALYSVSTFKVPQSLGVPRLPRPTTAIPICIVILCFLGSCGKPSGGIGNDTISYHLLGPAIWNSQGRIGPVLDHSHTAFPATIETLFAAGMLLSNDRAPGVIDTFFFVILLVQVAGLTRSIGASPAAMSLAVLLLATMPVIADFANNGFVDVAYACFAIASIRLAVWPHASHYGLLSGAFAGLSAGTKYTGIMFACLCCLLYACRQGFHQPWRKLAVFPAGAILIACPWYIRNWVVLGSPIYPIPLALSGVFHSSTFPHPAVLGFNAYILDRGKGLGRGLRYLLALPFTYTYYTAAFQGAGGIGLAPLAFTPLALYETKAQKESRYLLLMAVALTVVWFVTQQEARFLIPVVCVATAFAALGGDIALRQLNGGTTLLASLIIWISVVYGTLLIVPNQWPRLSWMRGDAAEAAQRANNIPYWGAFEYLNRTDSVKRILVLDAKVPTYYLLKPYLKILGPYGERPMPGITTQEEALREAGNMAITHVLEVEHCPYGVQCRNGFDPMPISAVGCKRLDLVFSQKDARIYHCY